MPIYNIKLIGRKEVARGTMAFTFEKPKGFTFKVGQFADYTLINPKVHVNNKSLIYAHGNQYSVPVEYVGYNVEVSVGAQYVEIFHGGKVIAKHTRAYEQRQMVANIYHYLPLLMRKPGALKKSTALMQSRANGSWPVVYDKFWKELKDRFGESRGTAQLINLLWWAKEQNPSLVERAMEMAQHSGSISLESVQLIVRSLQSGPQNSEKPLIDIGKLLVFDRPKLGTESHDILLQQGA